MPENKEKIWLDRLIEELKILDELNKIEGKLIESKSYLDIKENHYMEEIMEEINEIQGRLKKLEKHKKLSDPVDFYDFSNLKKRK